MPGLVEWRDAARVVLAYKAMKAHADDIAIALVREFQDLGIDLDDSVGLRDAMQQGSVQTVTNIKRRVRYRALQIVADFVGDSGKGDAS